MYIYIYIYIYNLKGIYNNGLVWSPYMKNSNENNDNNCHIHINNNNNDYDKDDNMNIYENKKISENKINQLNRYVCTALSILEEFRQKIICNSNDNYSDYNNEHFNCKNDNQDSDHEKSSSTVIVKCEAMELILENLHYW
jgi:hypothetical protein